MAERAAHETGKLPDTFATELGWPENADDIDLLFRSIDKQAERLGTKYWTEVPEEVLATTASAVVQHSSVCGRSRRDFTPTVRKCLEQRITWHQARAPFRYLPT